MKGSVIKRGTSFHYIADRGRSPATGKRCQILKGRSATIKEANAALADMLAGVHRGIVPARQSETSRIFTERCQTISSRPGLGTTRLR